MLSIFVYADNLLSLFADKLVNETTISPTGKGTSEENPTEHYGKKTRSIKVSKL